MNKIGFRYLIGTILICVLLNLCGCAALKQKFTRKSKEKKRIPVHYQVREYDIKPSIELYEKHYVFWINWHRTLVDGLGENFKSDQRSIKEMIGNLEDMVTLLIDEKAELLGKHVEKLREARVIIDRRNMTKANDTRIRRIIEREFRAIKNDFSPVKMRDHIRTDWK
ncbi:MAG: hypothetical protein ABID09_07565 [Candidatus Omnitrophota bacterium]